jgi:hypothetical protein
MLRTTSFRSHVLNRYFSFSSPEHLSLTYAIVQVQTFLCAAGLSRDCVRDVAAAHHALRKSEAHWC